MIKFTSQMALDYASKLMFDLTPVEIKNAEVKLSKIETDLKLLNQISNIKESEPMTHCLDDFEGTLREDIPESTPPVEELLGNCANVSGTEVEVPRVVD